jgi:hypothetical protein
MYVYGILAGTTDLTGYFTVTDGSFTVTGAGTGATLTVLDSKGATFATYTIIVFGDVNGDNSVAPADYLAVIKATQGVALTGAYGFAADVNGDGTVAPADYLAIIQATQGVPLNTNPYAK